MLFCDCCLIGCWVLFSDLVCYLVWLVGFAEGSCFCLLFGCLLLCWFVALVAWLLACLFVLDWALQVVYLPLG